ncbi:unnamed protein product [Brassica rapa subsp. trilocularis]
MQAHLSWQRSDDKDANQNSSLIHQAISSLTNILYILHTHYQFTYLNPLPSSSIAPPGLILTSAYHGSDEPSLPRS